jgi:DNA-3-methyladenine glycosylase I
MNVTTVGADGQLRCSWCESTPAFLPYHDQEWGHPVKDDRRLFEKLSLEGFQAGLSWRTILEKRPHFRTLFLDFDFDRIALFTGRDVERLLNDKGIIRHRGKIEAVVNNACRAQELVKQHGSLAAFVWQYEAATDRPLTVSPSVEAVALSEELKKLGWKFVGPMTVYSLMQAMGLINAHVKGCVIRVKVEEARKKFKRPIRRYP